MCKDFNCRLRGLPFVTQDCVHARSPIEMFKESSETADMIDKLTSQITHIRVLKVYLWRLPISQYEKQEANFRLARHTHKHKHFFCLITLLPLTFDFNSAGRCHKFPFEMKKTFIV
jgi:hypothetical protein